MKIKEMAESLFYNMDVVHFTKLSKGRMLPVNMHDDQVIECSIVAVDYIIEEIQNYGDKEYVTARIIYWKKVKKELSKRIKQKINKV